MQWLDITTILGLILGIFFVLFAILETGELSSFIQLAGLVVVVGGTFASIMVSYPLKELVQHLKSVKVIFQDKGTDAAGVITSLVSFAEKARREGLLALEAEAEQLNDPFLQKGIQLVVDGTDPELVRSILDIELTFLEERHKAGQGLFEMLGSLAPAYGMLATVVGLVNMLGNLDSPENLGTGMALALLTTFYGSLLANLFFLPMAKKLKVKSSEEILLKEVMIEGILSIQAGENPRIVEEKMKAFLAPKTRAVVENRRHGGES